ncbi:MAG: hypothetical protein ACOYLH_05190 [Flavobacteriales bacterium]
MSVNKNQNINYLKRLQSYKKIGQPILHFLDRTRLLPLVVPAINFTLKKAGVRKRFQKDLNYRLFSRAFQGALKNDNHSPNIVVTPFLSGGNNIFLIISAMIARYLQPKGYRSIYLVCDRHLPVCNNERIMKTRETDGGICTACFQPYKHIIKKTGADIRYLSAYHDEHKFQHVQKQIAEIQTLDECVQFTFEQQPIGRLTEKSVLRFFYVGWLENKKEHVDLYKKFLEANVRYSIAWVNFIASLGQKPDLVMIYNGTLAFESVMRDHCKNANIDYMTHETYVGTNSWIFKKNNEVMLLNWEEQWNTFNQKTFTHEMADQAADFLEGLRGGKQMYAKLNERHDLDEKLQHSSFVALFTNLNFDTAVLGRNPHFQSMHDWIEKVIRFWREYNITTKLVIRVHPAELKLITASSDFIGDKIKSWMGDAQNIMLYDAADKVDSYALIEHMRFGLIYSSTIGMEIAYAGKPVLIGGDAFFKKQPFVHFHKNENDYFEKLTAMLNSEVLETPDKSDVLRFVNFIYFDRVKRLNGLDMNHAQHVNTFDFSTADELVQKNLNLLHEFETEVIG